MNKKLLLIAVLSVFAFGSCTQQYICQCEVSYEGDQPGLPAPVKKESYVKDTHDEATRLCEENSTVFINDDSLKMIQNCRLF